MVEDANFMLNYDVDVFESKFIYWSELPHHLKLQVLRNLPYPSLRNFMFLSRECFELASRVDTEAYSVYVTDPSEENEAPETTAELTVWYIPPEDWGIPDSHKPFNLLFTNDANGGCYVERVREKKKRKYSGKRVYYTNETCLSAALRVFFRLTRNIKAKELEVKIDSLSEEVERVLKQQQTTFLFNCQTFIIRTEDRRVPPLLFPFIPIGCALKIYCYPFPEPDQFILDSDSFDLELLRAAPSFDTEGIVRVTDEQLPNLRGHTLSMKAPCITSKGVSTIIRQWLDGSRRIVEMFFNECSRMNNSEIFDGIDESVILSESEILKCPIINERLDPTGYPGFHAGIRNKSGALLVVTLQPNRCVLFDPYAEEDEP